MAAIALMVTGCSGINSTQSVSPLSFFLPGVVQASPQTDSLDSLPVFPAHPAVPELARLN